MQQQEKILIVDDHPINVEILEEVLGDQYQLATAFSGQEALAVASRFQPALILLDIMMPGLDGYETCRQLREDPVLRHTKIMMVSAKAMPAERLQGYEAGADDYITKPFNKEELLAKVNVYLRLKSAEEVNQLQSDTLALLSHETRTPLNGIIAPILQMLRDDEDISKNELALFLEMINHSVERLMRFFERVMVLSRMKAGDWAFQFAPSDLCDVIHGAIEDVAPHTLQQHVKVEHELPESAAARLDAEQMREVVASILENAVRFSPLEGCVRLELTGDEAYWSLHITDQGEGIAAAFLPRLFEEFAQADIENNLKGQGLSLALARQIVQAHEGVITVESRAGEGTTFTIRLPRG